MEQQAARMARLVDDLLALSRIELTEHAPPTTQVQLPGLLSAVSQALRLRAEARSMRIDLDCVASLPAVIGDSDELSQVFQNLIDNAIKYAAAGTTIDVTAGPSAKIAQGVAVAVRDRGEGIAECHLSRLTERFYRVDTARSCAAGGTGLGLAIVKHVLTRHRGLLDVQSTPGQGSVFTVHLCAANHTRILEPSAVAAPVEPIPASDEERLDNPIAHRPINRRPSVRGRSPPLRIVDRTTGNRTG
jgi:two-component system phosphate regulon sensor histidine kinase PhoR